MKTKYTIVITLLFMVSLTSHGQLKVDPLGHVGIGTNWPNSSYKCHIAGNLLLSSYPANPFYELTLKVGNGWPGTEIGSTADRIAFWQSWTGYNKLYAEQFYKQSDSTLKTNIVPLENALETIMKVKTYSYNLKKDKESKGENTNQNQPRNQNKKQRKEYGFISQEMETILPELTDTMKGTLMMDYDQLIPFLVEGMKEQQEQIKTLQTLVYSQEQDLIEMKKQLESYSSSDKDNSNSDATSQLFDNNPNPFTLDTKIKFYISENARVSRLIIHDLQGIEIKSFNINQTGYSSIILNGSELKAGMYLCTLLVDNKIIDTKRMVLSK